MVKKQGTSNSGNEWTCVIDRQGFHFSIQKNDFVLAEFVDTPKLTQDEFHEIVNKLDYELNSSYGKVIDEQDKLLTVDNVEEVQTVVEEQVRDGTETE